MISAPKFIETGIIGTRKMPRKIRFSNTAILFSSGSVISTNAPATVTPRHTARIVQRYLCVFYSITPAAILAATPKIAVEPPYKEIKDEP